MSVTTRVDAEKKRVVINISGKFDFSLHQQFREAYRDRTEREAREIVHRGGRVARAEGGQ